LEEIIKNKHVKIVMLASPGNPLGKVWNKSEFEKLNVLSEKYNFSIIFDAVYQNIYYDSAPLIPVETDNKRIYITGSFSKMLSVTGWRIGFIITEKENMNQLRAIHDYIGLCAPTLFQRVIADYLEKYRFGGDYITSIRNRCKQSCILLKKELCALGLKTPDIQGGYFLWAELPPKYEDGFEFAIELYNKKKVAVVPGENFSPNKINFVRLNFAIETDIVREACSEIQRFMNE
jgi:aspartate/methionine/tyrosine aminotransferase